METHVGSGWGVYLMECAELKGSADCARVMFTLGKQEHLKTSLHNFFFKCGVFYNLPT